MYLPLATGGYACHNTTEGTNHSGSDEAGASGDEATRGGAAGGTGRGGEGNEAQEPADAVTLVFRVGCIVKKLFFCSRTGEVPLKEVEYVADRVAERMDARLLLF
jgi:hypothetical protein